jgi:hypothetical protein
MELMARLAGQTHSLRSSSRLTGKKFLKTTRMSKKTPTPQNSLRTHRPLVMMWACTRIHALARKANPLKRGERAAPMIDGEHHSRQEVHSSPESSSDSSIATSFDDLAKGLASGTVSRLKALRLMGGALVAAALAAVPGGGAAWAQAPSVKKSSPRVGRLRSVRGRGHKVAAPATNVPRVSTGPSLVQTSSVPPTKYMTPLQRTEPVAAPAEKMR